MDVIIFIVTLNNKVHQIQCYAESKVKLFITEMLDDSKNLVVKDFDVEDEKQYIVSVYIENGKLVSFSSKPMNIIIIVDVVSINTSNSEGLTINNYCLTSSLFRFAKIQSDTVH